MALELINVGTVSDDRTGDTGRDAFIKVNNQFTELYSVTATALQADGSVDSTGDQLFTKKISIGSDADFTGTKAIHIAETFDSPASTTICSHIYSTLSGTGNNTNHSAQEFAIEGQAGTWTDDVNGAYYAPFMSGGTWSKVNGGYSLILTNGGTITDAKCFKAKGGIVTGTIVNCYGFYSEPFLKISGTAPETISGFWADKQTLGTVANYGIVLNGDDLGADIAFGTSQQLRMHHDGTNWTLEGAGIAAVASTATVNNTIPIDINGTVYHIMLSTTA